MTRPEPASLLSPPTLSIAQVLAMIKNPHYLYRMTVLAAISSLATIVSADVVCNSMLPVILGAAKDKVCGGGRGEGGVVLGATKDGSGSTNSCVRSLLLWQG